MKEGIKRGIASLVFACYRKGILKNSLRVCSIPETVETLIRSEKSLVRFGDGEIKLIAGREIPFQKPDAALVQRLQEILQNPQENLLVALPDVFEDVSDFVPKSRDFWMEHMLFHRKDYERICRKDRIYENAFFSRPYIMYRDKSGCGALFERMKKIWEGREIVFVEGEISHNGVGVDLFDSAESIQRILCPSSQAWEKYDRILNECRRLSTDKLVLVSLGAAGKVLAQDLCCLGYRVVDIGSLDMEYGWFCEGATEKCRVPKHEVRTRAENEKEGYFEYLDQIIATIR